MGVITSVLRKKKSGYATILRIWSTPPPGAPWYYWTYVSFDCNVGGRAERVTIKLKRLQCKKFVRKNAEGDTGFLIAKGDVLISWEPVSDKTPLPKKSDIKVFISYSQKWSHDAQYISQILGTYGLSVWFDKNQLRVGDKLNKEIINAIESCNFFIPLLSQDYFNSAWCIKEFETAVKSSRKRILPIKVSEGDLVMPPHLKQIYEKKLGEPVFLDIRKKDSSSNIKKLAEQIRESKS